MNKISIDLKNMFTLFQEFPIAKFQIKVIAKEDILLPEYKGSTLRGAFGVAFKKICCIKKTKKCNDCLLKNKCAYSLIFESSQNQQSSINEIPRPFVIEPPLEKKRQYLTNDELIFGLILFGNAIEYLPYIIYTFIELGKIGIGKNKRKFELKEVINEKGDLVYDNASGIFRNNASFVEFDEINLDGIDELKISFLTPTRIKYHNHYIDTPEFHIIIRALLRRISSLMKFYCDKNLKLDFKKLILQAEDIKIKQKDINWIDWERYSSRQKTKMKLGGFVGEVVYKGNISPFMPFLMLGEYTHIGKNCTFGLGKYTLQRSV